jgi:DNA-directed RNA polymerase specialized sigma subunit
MLRERFLNGYSREEMAYRWGVSVERVERIEKDAIKKVYKTVDGLFKEKEAKR